MLASPLCLVGLHRWKRVRKGDDTHEECARCGKLQRPITLGDPKFASRANREFFRSGMAPDRETNDDEAI